SQMVFVGNSGVGKSSFIHRFCYDRFLAEISATIGNILFSYLEATSGPPCLLLQKSLKPSRATVYLCS
uniref:Uncharacterized protein n=1 Tax=Chelonoidis abingdonii TaxID=106734 RepID=A0A8C0HCT9_CHEAB